MATNSYYTVPELEEYAERFKELFKFKRKDGILELRMHKKAVLARNQRHREY